MRKLTLVLMVLMIAIGWQTQTARADHLDSTYIKIDVPFTGYWDKFGWSHPGYCPTCVDTNGNPSKDPHHIVECEPATSNLFTTQQYCPTNSGGAQYTRGDWALDFYGSEGDHVRFNATTYGTTLDARVFAIEPSCGPRGGGSGSIAGWTVFVNLYVNGSLEGYVSYSHLNGVNVKYATLYRQVLSLAICISGLI